MRKRTRILLLRRAIFALLILGAHLLQNTPGAFPSVCGVRAFFLLSLTVCLGLFEREVAGALFGAFAGVLWDSVSPLGDGFHALLFMLIGAACGILINTILRNNLFTALLLSAGAHLLYAGLYVLFFVVAEGVEGAGYLFLRFYLPAAALSVPVGPKVCNFIRATPGAKRPPGLASGPGCRRKRRPSAL